MFAFSQMIGTTEEEAADALQKRMKFPWRGPGTYIDKEGCTIVTVQDDRGERSYGELPTDREFRIVMYVTNQPWEKTIFCGHFPIVFKKDK